MPTRILIADDNVLLRTALRQLLESVDGWDIAEAGNGQEAIAKVQEAQPDLIILDLAMPVMDGLTAARQISKSAPNTPILMYTLHSSPQVELEAKKVGVRKIVPKSESALLIASIQEMLRAEPPVLSKPVDTILPNASLPSIDPPAPAIEVAAPAQPETPETPVIPPSDVPDGGPPGGQGNA